MKVSDLARTAGVPIRAVKYWVKLGLIPIAGNDCAGTGRHQVFDERARRYVMVLAALYRDADIRSESALVTIMCEGRWTEDGFAFERGRFRCVIRID